MIDRIATRIITTMEWTRQRDTDGFLPRQYTVSYSRMHIRITDRIYLNKLHSLSSPARRTTGHYSTLVDYFISGRYLTTTEGALLSRLNATCQR